MSSRQSKLQALKIMHPGNTRNLLARESRQVAIELLDGAIATTLDLSLAARQAQWSARGGNYAALQRLFAEIADRLVAEATSLAERSAALGGMPRATPQGIAGASSLKPYPVLGLDADEHTEELASRAATLATELRQSIYDVERVGDPVTTHLLTRACTSVETILCRLESHLPIRVTECVSQARTL